MCGILLVHDANVEWSSSVTQWGEAQWDVRDAAQRLPGTLDAHVCSGLMPLVQKRGPNYSSLRVEDRENTMWFSSVLSLRQPFTAQCVLVGSRFVLQFNGELYNEEIRCNDTMHVARLLGAQDPDVADPDVGAVIRSLEGEFAYTIFDRQSQLIYFGRDSVGKRSLSYSFHEATGQLYIASVTGVTPEDWKYENCVGGVIYKYDIKAKQLDDSHLIQPLFQVTDLVDPTEASLPETIDRLFSHLSIAVEKRIKSIHPKHIKNSPISILFSGGLDCSVLVALICQYLISSNTIAPTIELLNVAFENPRTGLQPSQAPDRLLAQNSYSILKNLFPQINILLLEIDVPYQEYLQERSKVIDLMYPKDTEMDLSIAIAFYFASRGHGNVLLENGDKQPYDRHGIVLFSGLGADELYGGYHKFNNKSQQDLIHELTRQINNIHDRNLNRDDKVIAHNGVEVRYPFLDINVIDFSINQIPINFKINKLILRHLAKQRLNLAEIALEPKRAIQFGSKSAKMTKNGNKKGTDLLK